MKVLLHHITKSDDGVLDISVSSGDAVPNDYRATYDEGDGKYKYCEVDQELFMSLSDLAHKRFGNCAVYQTELMGIIGAFVDGDPIPDLPAELGTTSFCKLRPSLLRITWNKFIILLYKIGIGRSRIWVNPDCKKAV